MQLENNRIAASDPHRSRQRTRKDYAPPLIDVRGRRRTRAIGYTLGFLAALGALASLLLYDAQTIEKPETGLATATIDDITDEPGLYDGRRVTVVGDSEDGDQLAFTLRDDDLLLPDGLLVVNDGAVPGEVDAERWRATGRLEVYDGTPLRRGSTVVGADLELGQPVLIATRVAPLPPPTMGW